MRHTVALVTPTHRNDLERFGLLCDSIDRHVSGYERHYVVVNNDDLPLFARFVQHTRVVISCSQLLPPWLKLIPSLRRKGRRIWLSLLTWPVHGWHVQQLLKIAAALRFPEQRYCIVDSDNVFFRPFDVGHYAGGDNIPLYVDRAVISAEAPLHATWTRNCDRLLGHTRSTAFPADDYVGNAIVWDQSVVRAMTQAIERATGRGWAHALCRARHFSEYLLYGHFVRQSPAYLARHRLTAISLINAYWDDVPLDRIAVAAMIEKANPSQVALCIESFSRTPVAVIRDVVGLQNHLVAGTTSLFLQPPGASKLDAQLHYR